MRRVEPKDLLRKLLVCAAASGAIYLYINSFFVILVGIPLGLWLDRKLQEKKADRLLRRKEEEFRDLLCGLASELRSGKSLPNAFAGARRQVMGIWGEESAIKAGMKAFSKGLEMNIGIVECCVAMHNEIQIKESEKFTIIVKLCTGTGGDLIRAISNCANEIIAALQMKQETKQIILERKMEQNILLVMPHALYWLLELMTPGYASVLRTTLLGGVIMVVALVLWGGAWALSNRIISKEM